MFVFQCLLLVTLLEEPGNGISPECGQHIVHIEACLRLFDFRLYFLLV